MTQEQLDLPRRIAKALYEACPTRESQPSAGTSRLIPWEEIGDVLPDRKAWVEHDAAAVMIAIKPLLDLAESAGRMREALFIAAPQHQGGNGITGWVISQALGVPHPIECKDLVSKARDEGRDPAKLWPWLVKMRPGFFTTEELVALSPAQSTEGEEGQ